MHSVAITVLGKPLVSARADVDVDSDRSLGHIGAESQDAPDHAVLLKKPKDDEAGGVGIKDGEFDDLNGLGDTINAGFNSLRRPARRLENDRGEVAKKPLLD
eukprot:3635627-Pyramimonas_sp.AAC.1